MNKIYIIHFFIKRPDMLKRKLDDRTAFYKCSINTVNTHWKMLILLKFLLLWFSEEAKNLDARARL